MNHPMKVDLSSPRDMVLTKHLDAPRDLVWQCWTDPAHLAAWWGPHDFTARCELDVRPGGKQTIFMIDKTGAEFPIDATYLEIIEGEKIVGTLSLDEGHIDMAEIVDAYKNGTRAELFTILMTITLADAPGGGTQMTITQTFLTESDRDANMTMGAEAGWRESLEKLDSLLQSL